MASKDSTRPSILEVRLNDVRVGTITQLPYDRNLFAFGEEYVASAERPVLSLGSFDSNRNLIVEPEQVQTRVPSFFSNLLPEGRLREYVAELAGVSEKREFYLLWLLGKDLPGAVSIRDLDGRELPPSEKKLQAARLKRNRPLLRFSLAGVQLKFSAVGNPRRQLTIPVEGRGGHWIVKLPSTRFPLLPENEYSMMTLAKAVGLDVAEVGLVQTKQVEGLPPELAKEKANSLYVRRFDRSPDGKVHIEDFNQIYRQFPEAKYKNYSYTNMASDIGAFLGRASLLEFLRRLIFNAAIGNGDMHLKNWSVIYRDGRTPQLSPAYDFVSTVEYLEDRRMALSIAREKDTKYLDEDLLTRFATKARIPQRFVTQAAMQMAEEVVQAFQRMSSDLPLSREARQKISSQMKYVPLTRQFMK